ncbi:MAG: 8-oxoguanine deaminase [Burkholderiales bacterium]
MKTLLLKNALVVATMDDARREIADAGVFIRGNVIEAVGPMASLPRAALEAADEVIDCTGHLLMPGMVNTHHHFFQTLTRATPGGQDAELFDWLSAHYPIWRGVTPEMMHVGSLTAMAELALSGCTTTSDHQYLYTNGVTLDDAISAAAVIGMRFHATRGAMTVGRSQGGLPPDEICEREDGVIRDYRRLVEAYHDASDRAMLRIVFAPCSPFSVSQGFMRESAQLARLHDVQLHTHLAENDTDVAYTREKFNCTPAEYCEQLGWLGPDVWHAHCVKLDPAGIALFAKTGTGVAHCPSSNMRLGSGIAPVRAMLDAGVKVSIAVDGSASSDASHMLNEVRQAMLLQRVGGNPAGLSAREALWLATRGGAAIFDRDDIGRLAPGAAADIIGFDMRVLDYSGALHDPVAALVFCAPKNVTLNITNGRTIVRDGHLTTLDLGPHIERHNRLAKALVG